MLEFLDSHRAPTRPFAAFAVALAVMLTLLSTSANAEVDQVAPSGQVGSPAQADAVPWMVDVWDFAEIDGVVYVAGQFTQVRRWAGDSWENQPFLAAFDAEKARPISTFAPQIDAPVFALEVSSDGSTLYAGGEFTEVNGEPRRGLVALDPSTGTTVPAFSAEISGTDRPVVMDLEREGSQLYVAGSFNRLHNDTQGSMRRTRVAAVFEASGHANGFRPTVVGGKVYDVELTPSGDQIYLGGGFSSVNGDPSTQYFASLTPEVPGELVPDFNHGVDLTNMPRTNQPADVFAMAATNEHVWIGTERHLLQQLEAATGSRLHAYFSTWWDNTYRGGDFQELLIVGNRLYSGSHAYGMMVDLQNDTRCRNRGFLACRDSFPQSEWIDIRGTWVQAFDVNSGDIDPSFRAQSAGSSGVWALHWSEPTQTLWFGGDITHNQFTPANGFARMLEGSATAGPVDLVSPNQTRDRVILNWKHPVAGPADSYEIEVDGVVAGTSTTRWHTVRDLEPDQSIEVRVRASGEGFGDDAWSELITVSTLP